MNYIELINNFWAHTEDIDLSSSDTAVYFALLKYNNSLQWKKSFRCDYAVICQYARVSKNTFYKSMDNLQDYGLIKYEKGQRNKLKPKVFVLNLKNKKGTIKEQEGNNKGIEKEQNEEQKGNLYKLLNYKTIKLLNTSENAKLLNENFEKWLEMEKEENSIKSKSEKEKKDSGQKKEKEEICFNTIFDDFNSLGGAIPKIKSLSDKRKSAIKARVKEHGIDSIKEVFAKIKLSDFLNGRKTDWKANFDWIFNPTNFLKIMEGNYDNDRKSGKVVELNRPAISIDSNRRVNNSSDTNQTINFEINR